MSNAGVDQGDGLHRRDFIAAVAASTLGLSTAPVRSEPTDLRTGSGENYPPRQTGMRGSGTPSAYTVGHQIRDHQLVIDEAQVTDTGETYDLIVVGGGISGLAAAYYFRKAIGPGVKVLVLDNHDDFGGHAKRNEFVGPDGRLMISNAGTFDLSTDGSMVVEGLLNDLGIDLEKLISTTYDRGFYARHGMSQAVFFDKETFGADKLLPDPSSWIEYLPLHAPTTPPDQKQRWARFLREAPMPMRARQDVFRLYNEPANYFPGLTPEEREQRLRSITYRNYLLEVAKVDPLVVAYLRDRTFGSARGLDEMTAFAARRRGMPGFLGMAAGKAPPPARQWADKGLGNSGHITYHFPDGNATVARLLVRKLIPSALPGNDVEGSITAKVNYALLDQPSSPARIRLESTAVRVEQQGEGVAVTYARGGKLYRAHAGRTVLACWHFVIPHICPELPTWQKEALSYAVKAPNLWAVVWLRNWQAFKRAGACFINAPTGYYSQMILEHPINIGGYHHAGSPNQPTKLTMLRGYNYPGMTVKDQYRAGRAEMYGTSLEDFRREAKSQLGRMLGPSGFDPERDILDMTVNRWGHGYAYMYSNIYDEFVNRGEQPPHQRARQRYGRITIANTDAAGIGSTACAIDQAYRAVGESLSYDSLNIFY